MVEKENLVSKLFDRTERGKIDWQQFGSESFYANVGNGVLQVDREFDKDFEEDHYKLVIRSEGGQIIETMTSGQLPKLYDLARRYALKVDDVLESLSSTLDAL